MKRILYSCLIIVSLIISQFSKAQMQFTTNPVVQCYVGPITYTTAVQISTFSACSPPGQGSYSWTVISPLGQSTTVTPVPFGSVALISYTACGIYTITAFAYTVGNPAPCQNVASTIEIVCPTNGNVNITGTSANASVSALCAGYTATLTGSGAASYVWVAKTSGVTTTLAIGNPAIHTPTANTTYTMIGTTAQGCTVTKNFTINVQKANLSVAPASTTLCLGAPLSLTATAGAVNTPTTNFTPNTVTTGIQWTNPNNAVFSNTLIGNTTATVAGVYVAVLTHTGAAGTCTLAATTQVSTISVVPLTITPSAASVCPGSQVTMTAVIGAATQTSGAAHSWTASLGPGPFFFTGNPVTRTINSPTDFTVKVNYYGCTGTQTIAIGIATITPTLSLLSPAGAILSGSMCPNSALTLSASGGINYTFTAFAPGPPVIALPGSSTLSTRGHTPTLAQLNGPITYSVNANFNGCIGSASLQIGLLTLNTQLIPVSAPSGSACPNTSVVLRTNHGVGAISSYTSLTFNTVQTKTTIAPGAITSSVTFPTGPLLLAHTFSVSVDSAGCKGTSQITISKMVIVPNFTATPALICPGSTVNVLSSGGAGTNYTFTVPGTHTITQTNTQTSTLNPILVQTPITPSFPYSYTVSVDSAGCQGTGTVSIDSFTLTRVLTASSPSVCAGSTLNLCATLDGTLITAGNNTFTADYTITAGSPTVPVLSPSLSCSNHSVPISPVGFPHTYILDTDSAGCIATSTISVGLLGISSNFTLSASSASVCPNTTFTLTATGNPSNTNFYTFVAPGGGTLVGTPPGSSVITHSASVLSLAALNAYTVSVDSGGCVGTSTIAVGLRTLGNVSLTASTSTVCAGVPFTLAAIGTGSLTSYTLGAVAPQTISAVSPSVNFPGLFPGITQTITTVYVITAADSAGCKSPTAPLASQFVTVTLLPGLSFTPVPTSYSVCPGLPSTITISGAPNYTYTWLAPPTAGTFAVAPAPSSSAVSTPSTNATYTISAIDPLGCVGTNSITIGIDPLATLSVNIAVSQTTLCNNQSSTLTASCNVNPVTFTWSPAGSLNAPFGPTVVSTPTLTTIYTATAGNGFGCFGVSSTTVTVGNIPAITFNAFPASSVCAGFTSTLTALGGQSYTWTGSTFTNAIAQQSISVVPGTSIAPATYSVLASNGGGCTSTAVFTVGLLSPLVLQYSQSSQTTCITNNDPKYSKPVVLNVSGAATYVWFPYNPYNMTYSLGPSTTVRPPTTTQYTVTGATSICSGSVVITVTVTPQFTINVVPPLPAMCLGDSLKLSITNVGPPNLVVGSANSFTYTWKEAANAPPISLSNNLTQTVQAFPQNTTTYTVEVHDSRECVSLPRLVTVTVLPRPITAISIPTINSLATNTVCYVGLNPGAVDNILTLTGINKNTNLQFGVVPTYTWLSPYNPKITSILTPVNNNAVTVNAPTRLPSIVVYTLVSGYNGVPGCTRLDTVSVRVIDCRPVTNVKFTTSEKYDTICSRQCITYVNLTDTMAGGVQKLNWKFDGGSPSTSTDNIVTVCYNLPGKYNVILSVQNPYPVLKADGSSGSSYTLGTREFIKVVDIPNVTIFSPGQIKNDTTIRFGQIVSLNGGGALSYDWSPSYNISSLTQPNVIVRPFKTTQYILTGYNSKLCYSSDTINVIVIEDCGEMYVPNAFSPNNDGHNDVLKVQGICLQSLSFMVFNRWGEKVFETTDQSFGWDGSYKGEDLNTGIFVYRLEGKTYDGKAYTAKGNITLIR